MLDLLLVKEATKLLIDESDYIFEHSCWFLRPWMGVYALRHNGGEREEEQGELWSELSVDAGALIEPCKNLNRALTEP